MATVGTYTNSDVSIITDNTPRVTVKNTGEVIFGSALTNSAIVTINGTLNVTTLLSDTRVDTYSPIEFKPSDNNSIYGLGLVWKDTTIPTRFVLQPNPDRLFSTISIDLDANQSYYINEQPVLSKSGLGTTVVDSNLTSVGTLNSLLVSGNSDVGGAITSRTSVLTPLLKVSNNNSSIDLTSDRLNISKNFAISVAFDNLFYADAMNVSLGNKLNSNRTINLYGQVGIGLSSIDPSVSLDVSGSVRFSGKKFITGNSSPAQGSFAKGDICWNQTPVPGSYIGWVCIADGGPGQWAPFGSISQQ